MRQKLHIETDSESGFCFGVVNAIDKAERALKENGEVCSLGDIVHNRLEVQRLADMGLRTIAHGDLESIRGKTMFIRAHGEPPSTYVRARELGITVVDATCPVVEKLHETVGEAWKEMKACGGQVVILGQRGHAEVIGLEGHAGGQAIVVESAADLGLIDFSRPLFFLSQTTQSLSLFRQLCAEIMERAGDPARVKIKDTICRRVSDREEHLEKFAARFDVVIFVAGRKSSNGRVLFEVCRQANPGSHHIEESSEIDPAWFSGASSVGICGATSTPKWLMEEVAAYIAEKF